MALIRAYKSQRMKYIAATSIIWIAMISTYEFADGKSWLFIVAGVFVAGAALLAYVYEKWSDRKTGKYGALLFFCGMAAVFYPLKYTDWAYRYEIAIAMYVIYCVVREVLTYKSFIEEINNRGISASETDAAGI